MRLHRAIVLLLALAAGAAAGAGPALAQAPRQTGTLRVVVKDPSGAVIPNATVVGRASGVPRHVASAVLNTNLTKNLRLALSSAARAGAPYTITTGRDDNGDAVFNDRPAGVGRNTATSAGMWDVAGRLTYAFGFGEKPPSASGPGGQMVVLRMGGGGAGDLLGGLGGGGAENKRVRFELFVAASNLFNVVNPMGYSGVMTSPFFGQATAAGPARKMDVGMKIGF